MKFKHSKLTKRLISGAVAALMTGAMLPMAAFAAESAQGKWPGYETPDYPEMSEGIEVTATHAKGKVDAEIIITDDAAADGLNINVVDGIFAYLDEAIGTVPGGSFQMNTTIINKSNNSYSFEKGSLVLGTDGMPANHYADPHVNTFDGYCIKLDSMNNMKRTLNPALQALGISDDFSDETVAEKLQAYNSKYAGGIESLDDFYVDYYNENVRDESSATIDSLAKAPMSYLEQLFSKSGKASKIRETNPDVAAVGYYYFFDHLFTINGYPLATYMETGSDTLAALDDQFAASMTALYPGDEIQLPTMNFDLSGRLTTNTYSDYSWGYGLAFSLEQGQPKTDYPGLEKWIVTDGNEVKQDNVAAGENIQFELKSNVPNDLINYMNPKDPADPSVMPANALVDLDERGSYLLTFHDELDAMLVNPTDFKVTIGTTTLDPADYTINKDPKDGCTFEVSLDLIALYNDSKITDEDIEKATEIKVTYTATLDEDAVAGTYENTAWVTYPSGESEKDIVEVDTYAINVFKYDQANPDKGLAGAEFTLYEDEACTKELAKGETGKDGIVRFDGLDIGTYYLKETKAPNGYVGSEEVLVVTITEDAAENTVSVQFANSEIPHTGGTGTVLFTVAGAAIIAGAGVLFVISRKRKKVNN